MSKTKHFECRRCLLDDNFPGLSFDDEGVCSECRRFDRYACGIKGAVDSAEKLRILLEKHRSLCGKPDCVVGSCGGTDSLYVIHLLAKRFNIKPLVVTVDNGFLNPAAKNNLKTVVDRLGLSNLYINPGFSKAFYRDVFNITGNFCNLCVYGCLYYLSKVAHQQKIKLIITGMSKNYDPFLPHGLTVVNLMHLVGSLAKKGIKHEIVSKRSCIAMLARLAQTRIVEFPDYMEWDKESFLSLLKQEYSLKILESKYDCTAHPLVNFLVKKRYGFDYYALELNQLIRMDKITKEQAKQLLFEKNDKASDAEHNLLDFGMSLDEAAVCLARAEKLNNSFLWRSGAVLRTLYLRRGL